MPSGRLKRVSGYVLGTGRRRRERIEDRAPQAGTVTWLKWLPRPARDIVAAMRCTVTSRLECTIVEPTDLAVLSVAVAPSVGRSSEELLITVDDRPFEATELLHYNTRLHRLPALPKGKLLVTYAAEIDYGTGTPFELPADEDAINDIVYLRPSRYADSDSLAAVAYSLFQGLQGKELLDAVTSWTRQHLAYVSGSSRPTDGAVQTFLMRQGVCRDFAHVVVAMLRARDVPARLVSVYAPGLYPMDFHAVAEAKIDGEWVVVDATGLAPRQSLVRIATGRDASDTSFLTTHLGFIQLDRMEVTAVADSLPIDDVTKLVTLA